MYEIGAKPVTYDDNCARPNQERWVCVTSGDIST